MDTRLILQIILGAIVALILVLGAVMLIALTGDAETVVIEETVEEEDEEEVNPWADLGDTAIAYVEPLEVQSDPGIDGDGDNWTVGELIEESEFVEEKLNLTAATPKGWEAQWWDETRYGSSYFRVRYAFEDEGVTVGPTWLVDVHQDAQDVAPKNVLGEVVTDPDTGVESEYYDQEEQVVSAIINHRFPADINLGGALLRYFEQREDAADDDEVLGWTVNHSYGELFQAYFQWTDDGEHVYAEFEYDYDEQALRPVNLQATEIMAVGEEFDPLERVDVYPGMYDPDEPLERNRWQGPAREQCQRPAQRDRCDALSTVLSEEAMMETLEWLLTEDEDSAVAYEECKQIQDEDADRPDCWWPREEIDDGVFEIKHVYDLGDGQHEIAWRVNLEDDEIEPLDSLSELAYRAVRPRR